MDVRREGQNRVWQALSASSTPPHWVTFSKACTTPDSDPSLAPSLQSLRWTPGSLRKNTVSHHALPKHTEPPTLHLPGKTEIQKAAYQGWDNSSYGLNVQKAEGLSLLASSILGLAGASHRRKHDWPHASEKALSYFRRKDWAKGREWLQYPGLMQCLREHVLHSTSIQSTRHEAKQILSLVCNKLRGPWGI